MNKSRPSRESAMKLRSVWKWLPGIVLVVGVIAGSEAGELEPQQSEIAGVGVGQVSGEPGAIDTAAVFALVLASIAGHSPVLFVMFAGAVLSVARWRRHPRISALVLSAVLIAALTLLTSMVVSAVLPQIIVDWELPAIGWTTAIIGLVTTTLHAVAWGLLLAAAFGWRNPNETVPRELTDAT